MSDNIRIGRIIRDINFVIDHWADLYEARLPGTKRPWAQTKTRQESRERTEHVDQSVFRTGASPAPCHVDVLDAIVDVVAIAHACSDGVSQLAGVERLPAPASAFSDPTPHLEHIRKNITAAAETDDGWIINSCLDPDDDYSILRARRRTGAALRLILAGQVLDADCPWCDARPLRIRLVKDEPLVVCESRRVCQPPETDCGTWIRGRPAWIQPEWEWLAQRIRHAEDLISA
jgi:hypothetical protein